MSLLLPFRLVLEILDLGILSDVNMTAISDIIYYISLSRALSIDSNQVAQAKYTTISTFCIGLRDTTG